MCTMITPQYRAYKPSTLLVKLNEYNENQQWRYDNAVKKKAFSELQVLNQDNYIMYMCSDFKFDYFKSKLTKTKYTVER